MAGNALTRYINLIKGFLPKGCAWNLSDVTNLHKLIQSLAIELCRVDERSKDLIEEAYPNTTNELLIDWERVAGLPDDCTEGGGTIEERRRQLVQKLTTGGGQSAAFFEEIGAQLGFDITVSDIKPFKAGISKAGDALTNDPIWTFWFLVQGPPTINTTFKAGVNTVGEPLVIIGNETLECTIKKLKPAHTNAYFIYEV